MGEISHLKLVPPPPPDQGVLEGLEVVRKLISEVPGCEVVIAVASPDGGLTVFRRESMSLIEALGFVELVRLNIIESFGE